MYSETAGSIVTVKYHIPDDMKPIGKPRQNVFHICGNLLQNLAEVF